jgi:surface polysaccharide O-acyltransferase-like enzyme
MESESYLMNAHPDGESHLFVDNVRFLSMIGIVAMHSTAVFCLTGNIHPLLIAAILTPLKFSTIGFFLISGFLLGERLERCRPMEYFGRRLEKVFLPWLFWVSLLVVARLTRDVIRHRVTLPFTIEALPIIGREYFQCATSTAFWFVPNLLVALCVLLMFRRYLNDLRLGAGLLAINLFYVVNIYTLWLPSLHSKALFGFVFYLWLGTYASRHLGNIALWVSQVGMVVLVGLAVLTGLIAIGEACVLNHLQSPDPNNSLRLSNQIFSIVMVLLIFKLGRTTWPRFVEVRSQTFGIYLSHTLVLDIVLSVTKRRLLEALPGPLLNSYAGGLGLWVMVTAVTYSICVAVTKAVVGLPYLQWIVGASSTEARPKSVRRLATATDPQSFYQTPDLKIN